MWREVWWHSSGVKFNDAEPGRPWTEIEQLAANQRRLITAMLCLGKDLCGLPPVPSVHAAVKNGQLRRSVAML